MRIVVHHCGSLFGSLAVFPAILGVPSLVRRGSARKWGCVHRLCVHPCILFRQKKTQAWHSPRACSCPITLHPGLSSLIVEYHSAHSRSPLSLFRLPPPCRSLLRRPPSVISHVLTDDQGEWATATTKKKKQPASQHRGGGGGYGNGPGGYSNGRGMDDRRGGRGGVSEKMRGVSLVYVFVLFLRVYLHAAVVCDIFFVPLLQPSTAEVRNVWSAGGDQS